MRRSELKALLLPNRETPTSKREASTRVEGPCNGHSPLFLESTELTLSLPSWHGAMFPPCRVWFPLDTGMLGNLTSLAKNARHENLIFPQ